MGWGRAYFAELKEEGGDDEPALPPWMRTDNHDAHLIEFPVQQFRPGDPLDAFIPEDLAAAANVDKMAEESGDAASRVLEGGANEDPVGSNLLHFFRRVSNGDRAVRVGDVALDDGLVFSLLTEGGSDLSLRLSRSHGNDGPVLVVEVGDRKELHDRNSIEQNVDEKMKLAALASYCRVLASKLPDYNALSQRFAGLKDRLLGSTIVDDILDETQVPEEVQSFMSAFGILQLMIETDANFGMIDHMVSSPLRTLGSGFGYLQMAENSEEIEHGLKMLENALNRLNLLFTKYVPQMEKEGLAIEAVDLREVFEKVSALFPGNIQNIEIESFEPVNILIAKWGLIALLENAFNNAFKAGADNIRIEVVQDAEMVTVKIHDDGKAIPSAVLAKLFTSQLGVSAEGSGSGSLVAAKFMADSQGAIKTETGRSVADKLRKSYGIADDYTRFYQIEMEQEGGSAEDPELRPDVKCLKLTFPRVTRLPMDLAPEKPAEAAAA